MITEDVRDRFDRIKLRALHDGVDLLEALDKAGLVVTEEQIKKQWADCLEQLAFNIDSQPIVAFTQMGGGQNTPLDTVRGILEYINIFRQQFAAQSRR